MIHFIKEQIIHKFGIPQSITTDQGTMFIGDEMIFISKDYGIQLIKSTPFMPNKMGRLKLLIRC